MFFISKLIEEIISIILNLFIVKKINKQLWLFGAWHGEQYSDNSKYFFEYVNDNMPNITCIWITRKKDIKNLVIKNGRKSYLSYEYKGLISRKRAGVVFFTNGIKDIGRYNLSKNAIKIALWHGMPLKKIGFATNTLNKRYHSKLRSVQYLLLKKLFCNEIDISIATSKKTKEFIMQSFDLPSQNVLITGQPRNDALFSTNQCTTIAKKLKHQAHEKSILYMPTWRKLNAHDCILDNIINNIINDIRFNNELVEKNIKLYIKLHPKINNHYKSNKNIIFINNDEYIDVQQLLVFSDVLISDYSSAFIDFALTDKQVHFFVPDLEEYGEGENGMFLKFEEFAHYWVTSMDDFKKIVINENKYIIDSGLLNSKKINNIYNDPDLIKGKYSQKLLKDLICIL